MTRESSPREAAIVSAVMHDIRVMFRDRIRSSLPSMTSEHYDRAMHNSVETRRSEYEAIAAHLTKLDKWESGK